MPWEYTGSAVGIISVIGYTPDIFMGSLMSILVDRSPNVAGHGHLFAVVAGFACVGLLASVAFQRIVQRES